MNFPTTRRSFLKRAALAPFATAMFSSAFRASAFAPIKRVGAAHLRPGVNAYSFDALLTANARDPSTGLDLFAVCNFCAEQNVDAVDLTGYFFPGYPKAPADSYVNRLKHYTHDLGLDISGTGVRNDFTAADKATRADGVQVIKDWIEVAARLGAPVVRVFADCQAPFKNWQEASGHATHETVEAWMADDLHECAEYAKKFGVIVAVQNHGDFISTGAFHLSLLQRVDHEWCGALVDTGKYTTEDPYADIALVAPYAVNWQIKETIHSRVESPRTDFKKLIPIIRQSGYRGYLPIETLAMHRADYDPRREVMQLLSEMRDALAAPAAS